VTQSFRFLETLQSYEKNSNGLLLNAGGPQVAVTALADNIVRVRLAPAGTFAARRSWAAVGEDDAFSGAAVRVEESSSELVMHTGAFSVHIDCAPLRISFRDLQGKAFCADANGLSWQEAGGVACIKKIETGEHFTGFGERSSQLEQSGLRMVNWSTDFHRYAPGTDPLYIAVPVFVSLRPGLAYGVYINNTWRSQFDMGATQPDVWSMKADGGELDYYVVFGPTPAEVISGFGLLLGKMPLPPRWALGYHQSRYTYMNETDVRAVAAELRSRQIPCDVIHFDIDHMVGYRDFTWNPTTFPDPKALLTELKQNGFRVVTVADPGVKIDPDYDVYADGIAKGMFITDTDGEVFHGYVWPDDSVFPDFTRADVRQWWAGKQHRMVEAGVSGMWNDMNEPTVFSLPFSQGGGVPASIPLDAPQGADGEQTTHAEVHNVYGSSMARASYEGLRESLKVRPFVLTRSGFAGIQRWSACWMGDNTSRWEHLELAISQLLNMGVSAVPFVGTDIGGFFDNANGELFARWMQFGALMPFCRSHTHTDTAPHEPWVFGPQVEAIARQYLQLRYRWMPYLYTLFQEASKCGTPVLRPLFYEFPNDKITYTLHDEVLLGPSILAAPVYQPGRNHRHVYLPEGQWYDFWTEALITGPANILAAAPLECMPIYIRAGAILPTAPDMAYTDERPLDVLTLEVYAGNGAFTLYEDDGFSFEYEQGRFCTTSYRVQQSDTGLGGLSIEGGARTGAYVPVTRKLVLRVHGVDAGPASNNPDAAYDAERRILTMTVEQDVQGFKVGL
jgi:alpha-glucosidase